MDERKFEYQLTQYQFLKDILRLSRECGLGLEKEIEKELKKILGNIMNQKS